VPQLVRDWEEAMNLIDVTKQLATDEQCIAYLEKMHWPDGIVRCPICGNNEISRITRKTASKNKRAQIFQCLEKTCKHQFSATTGTIFHDSHLPLHKWFMAIALVVDAKKGISALQLQQHLGIGSYKTAWYMYHRIRKAMVDESPTPLSGIVEVDETFIGGKAKRRGRPKKLRMEKFDAVVGMRERGGRVRFFHVPDLKARTMKQIIEAHISADVDRVMTDQAVAYDFAFDKAFKSKHSTVNHSIEWVKPGNISVHTNTVESAFSLLKRGLMGSFHRVSIKHLHRYLSEFEYRFNAREIADRFSTTLAAMCGTKEMPYQQLISDPEKA
jgi:transposase-like protein